MTQLNFKLQFSNPKRHYLAQNRVKWRIKRENPSNVGARKNFKKCSKQSKVLGVHFGYMGGGNPLGGLSQFFRRRHPRRNHVSQIWWRSVQGFTAIWGSNFAIPQWLWRSSLQHSHTIPCERVICQHSSIRRGNESGVPREKPLSSRSAVSLILHC